MTAKEKRCGRCGETKPVKDFYKHRGSQDGFQWDCKACVKKHNQSEKRREAQRKYDQSEKRRKAKEKYDRSEKGRAARRKAEKKYNHSEKRRKAKKKYNRSEKGRQSSQRADAIRRTRKTQAGGSYTSDQWYALCKFYDFRCLKCNKKLPFEKLTLDHVKPVSKGGPSAIWNTQPLCKHCNNSKNDNEIDYRKTLPDWIKRDGPIWIQDALF